MGSDVEVAAADREKAAAVILQRYGGEACTDSLLVGVIAQALADERAKTRAPFLALADELAASAPSPTWLVLRRRGRSDAWVKAAQVVDRIRRAAEEG